MSYKTEVIADSTGQWVSNAVRLATQAEAEGYGADLMSRWLAVRERRVVESDEPVNYEWKDGKLNSVSILPELREESTQ